MPSYSWVDLDPDEEVLVDTHPSAWTLLSDAVMGTALVIVAIIIVLRGPSQVHSFEYGPIPGELLIIGATIFLSGAMIGVSCLDRITTVYLVTSKRVFRKEGIISYHGDPIDIKNIVDQEAKQNPIERQLGYGTILLKTAATADVSGSDTDMGHLKFEHIPDPLKVKEELRRAEKMRRRHTKEEDMRHERAIRETRNNLRESRKKRRSLRDKS